MSSKEDVRSRLLLSEVISDHVSLTAMGGGRWRGLCPFHNEKTPSFNVDDNRGFYHCFGCKASGDVFKFVQEVEGLEFFEALQKLAARAGVELERRGRAGDAASGGVLEANEFALKYFRDHLSDSERAYLHSRGISNASIEKWELGHAPDSWDGLLSKVRTLRKNESDFLAAGVIRKAESGRLYDHFRGRIVFPIRDRLGRLLGFGGRDIVGDKAKYVNTAETEHFKKSKLLYGLREAAKADGRSEIVVVEGYMDVIAMHQHGFENAVASLGTALTEAHAAELARLGVKKLTLMFDSDEAGQKATLAGLSQSIGRSFLVRAAAIQGGKDPADVLQEVGRAPIEAALEGAEDEASFRVEAAIRRHGTENAEQKRAVLNELLPRLQSDDPFDEVVEVISRLLADRLGMARADLGEWVRTQKKQRALAPATSVPLSGNDRQSIVERALLREIANEPLLASKLDKEIAWRSPLLQAIAAHGKSIATHQELVGIFDGTPFYNEIIGLLHESGRIELLDIKTAEKHRGAALERSMSSFEDARTVRSITELEARLKEIGRALERAGPEEERQLFEELMAVKSQILNERKNF